MHYGMHEIKCQVNISNLSSSEEMMNRIWINSRNVNGVGGTCTGFENAEVWLSEEKEERCSKERVVK